MEDKKWEKLAALGGVAFVVLNVVGSIIQGAPPSAENDSPAEILDWFADNDTGIRISAFLGGLGMIGLAWWFGSLWRRMSRAEGGDHRLSIVALAGLAGGGALASASFGVLSAVAITHDDVSPEGARFFFVLSGVLLSTGGFFIVTHLAAVNALSLRTGLLPRWITIVGIVASALFLVATVGTATDADPIMFFGFAGFIVWCVWLVAVSIHMWRTSDAPSTVAEAVPVTA